MPLRMRRTTEAIEKGSSAYRCVGRYQHFFVFLFLRISATQPIDVGMFHAVDAQSVGLLRKLEGRIKRLFNLI